MKQAQRDTIVHFWVSAAEAEKLARLTDAAGVNTSDLLRVLVDSLSPEAARELVLDALRRRMEPGPSPLRLWFAKGQGHKRVQESNVGLTGD